MRSAPQDSFLFLASMIHDPFKFIHYAHVIPVCTGGCMYLSSMHPRVKRSSE